MKSRRRTRSDRPPERHTLVYDADCLFCTQSARMVQRRARVPVDIVPYENIPGTGMLTSYTPEEIAEGAHLITPRGVEYHDGEAMVRALQLTKRGWLLTPFNLPLLRILRDATYAAISRNRPLLSRVVAPLLR